MKFTIRDLMFVTVIVAVAVGWWVDRQRLRTLLKKGQEWREALQVEPIVNQYSQNDPRLLRE